VSVADAVQFAHEHGVLHRDIKPGNILFDEEGHAFVSDFGLAKLAERADGGMTGSAAMLGTPHYMAPEIAAHGLRAATTATDVWSLGVMLYELLAQARPFKSDSVPALMREIAEREPEVLAQSVPSDLRIIARKALTKDPARRYVSARAFADDLRCWLEGRPITARPTPGAERVWLWMKRNPALSAVSVLAALGMAAAIASLSWGLDRAKLEAKNLAAARDQIATANKKGQEQLRDALLQRATSGRIAGIVGWRAEGLAALRQAASIRGGVDMRSEAIAHLAGIDVDRGVKITLPNNLAIDPPAVSLTSDLSARFSLNRSQVVFADRNGAVLGVPVPVTFPSRRQNHRMISSFLTRNDQRLALYQVDGDVVLIDVPRREILQLWPGARFGGFTDDSELMAVLLDATHFCIHRTIDGSEVGRFESPANLSGWQDCRLHPEAQFGLVALTRGNLVEIWNWKEKRLVGSVQTMNAPGELAWSGDLLAIASRGIPSGIIWNIRMKQSSNFVGEGTSVRTLGFALQGRLLSAGMLNDFCTFWDAASGQSTLRGTIACPQTFDLNGRHFFNKSDGVLTIAEMQTSAAVETKVISSFCKGPAYLDISPDGRWLAIQAGTAASSPPWLTIWDLTTRQMVARLSGSRAARPLFLADSVHFAIWDAALNPAGESAYQCVLHALVKKEDRVEIQRVRTLTEAPLLYRRMVSSPDRRWLVLSTDKDLTVIDVADPASPAPPQVFAQFSSMAPLSGVGPGFALRHNGNNLSRYWWNPSRAEPTTLRPLPAYCSPDGRWVAQNRNRLFAFFAAEGGEAKIEVAADGNFSSFGQLPGDWSADSRYFALPQHRSEVAIVDIESGKIEATLTSPSHSTISDMRFTPDGCTLVIVREAGVLEIWNLTKLAAELTALGMPWHLPPPVSPAPPGITGPVKGLTLRPLSPR